MDLSRRDEYDDDVARRPASAGSANSLRLEVGEPFNVSLSVQAPSTTAFPIIDMPQPMTLDESQSSSKMTDQGDKLTALPTHGSRPSMSPRTRSGSIPASRYDSFQGGTSTPGRGGQDSISDGDVTPSHHVSFDRDSDPARATPTGVAKWKTALHRIGGHTSSDPVLPTQRDLGTSTPPQPPVTRGRTDSRTNASSIQRMLASAGESFRGASRTRQAHGPTAPRDPFIPMNPFEARPAILRASKSAIRRRHQRWRHIALHIVRLVYLHVLLRLPSLYFSRVCRVFEDADVSRPDIERLHAMALAREGQGLDPEARTGTPSHAPVRFPSSPREWATLIELHEISPALINFKSSWEDFVDGLMREWKTLNVVSALLLSAIVTIFQIEDAANDPTTRTAAFMSLAAALFALLYGCTFILRFSTMKRMEKASRWAQDAQRTQTDIFWNVWILLATPAIWLAWSVVFFIIAILAFLWTSGTRTPPKRMSEGQALGPRIAVTCMFAIGAIYFVLIVTTFRSYGLSRDPRYRHQHRHGASPYGSPIRGGLALSPQQTRDSQVGVGGGGARSEEEATRNGDQKKEGPVIGLGLSTSSSVLK